MARDEKVLALAEAELLNGRTYWWHAAQDNHTPARIVTAGYMVAYTAPDGHTRAWKVIGALDSLRYAREAVYLIDDGRTVVAAYSAGWSEEHRYVLAHELPVNDGRIRPDNGLPVDFGNWQLGPRRAYHFKVQEVPDV